MFPAAVSPVAQPRSTGPSDRSRRRKFQAADDSQRRLIPDPRPIGNTIQIAGLAMFVVRSVICCRRDDARQRVACTASANAQGVPSPPSAGRGALIISGQRSVADLDRLDDPRVDQSPRTILPVRFHDDDDHALTDAIALYFRPRRRPAAISPGAPTPPQRPRRL